MTIKKDNILFRQLNNKQITIWVSAAFILLVFVNAAFFIKNRIDFQYMTLKKNLPCYDEIQKIIKPLGYNGIERLKHDDVRIDLDFSSQTWRLCNVHRFNSEGKILLEGGRFGICGELAQYTYEKILPLLGDRYKINFVRAAESGYFLAPRASHFVLIITEKKPFSPKTYLLDPSFRRYGLIGDFDEYIYFEILENIPGMENKSPDEVFPIGWGVPLLIKRGALIMIEVERNKGKFDKDNFAIVLTATKQNRYSGRLVFSIFKEEGNFNTFENTNVIYGALSENEYAQLKKILLNLAKKYYNPANN